MEMLKADCKAALAEDRVGKEGMTKIPSEEDGEGLEEFSARERM